jgi:Tfp pilus assembly PilM family ATPase
MKISTVALPNIGFLRDVFGRQETSILALEIGQEWLKAAVAKDQKTGIEIVRLVAKKAAGNEARALSEALRGLLRELKTHYATVVVSIPRHAVTIRYLKLPSVNPAEIGQMADIQAIKQLPYSRDELVIAHKILEHDAEGYSNVMLVAVHKKTLQRYLDICKTCGLEPKKIALSTEAIGEYVHITGALAGKGGTGSTALIDIDALCTEIQVQRSGSLLFSRSIRLGLRHLEDEQQLKNWIEGIRLSFGTYAREKKEIPITGIVATGAARKVRNLDALFGKELNISAATLPQLHNIKISQAARSHHETSETLVSFSSVIALALNHHRLAINLLPQHLQLVQQRKAQYKKLTRIGMLVLCFILCLTLFVTKKLHDKEVYVNILKQRLHAVAPEADILNKKARLARIISRQFKAEGSCLDVIREVHAITPQNLYLTKLIYDQGKGVTLKGSSPSMAQIFKFVTIVEKSPYFSNVKLRYASKRKRKGSDLTDFEIYATLR